MNDNKSGDTEKPSKYKETFEELSNKRVGEIQNMSNQIDFNNLIYHFTTPGLPPINIYQI